MRRPVSFPVVPGGSPSPLSPHRSAWPRSVWSSPAGVLFCGAGGTKPNAAPCAELAMERLYFLAKIQRGLEQADSGDTLTHQEAKERLLK